MHKIAKTSSGSANEPRKVAVIGEGMNDVKAFKAAHVSLAMGSGTSYAKNNASMILTENDFEAALKAVMWGRNIYTNIKRFLQFQVTINFSVILIILLGMFKFAQSPFNVVDLLWINLIMDTLGALSLATLPPHASVIRQNPQTDDTNILSPVIWRQIYAITLYQTVFCGILMWFGGLIYDLSYDWGVDLNTSLPSDCPARALVDTSNDDMGCEAGYDAEDKHKHVTMVFNTFVWMCIFQMLNCRVVGVRDLNVFTNFMSSFVYLAVFAVVILIQYCAVCDIDWIIIPGLFQAARLSNAEIYNCAMSGATVLLAAFIVKLTPEEWVDRIPSTIDENKTMGEDSAMMRFYEKQANAKAFNIKEEDETEEPNAFGEIDDGYQKV